MPTPEYYCHNCELGVSLRDGDFVCARCGGEFIEEIPPDTRAVNPFASIFESLLSEGGGGGVGAFNMSGHTASGVAGAGAGPSRMGRGGGVQPTAIRFGSGQGGNTGDNIIAVFLNQLLSNLSAQGAQIQLQITRDPTSGILHGSMGDYAWGEGGLDQIVTQLLNQFEGGATPIDPKLIGNLPMITVEQSHVDADTQCTTCMERYKPGEKVAQLECHHVFHRECIVPWLQRRNTCPICRQVIDATKWPSCNPLDELD